MSEANESDATPLWGLTHNDLDAEVYDALRAIARSRLRGERANHTLSATELAHEALMKINRNGNAEAPDRRTLLNFAAVAMRQILIDHARGHRSIKRGSGKAKLDLADVPVAAAETDPTRILIVNEAVSDLAKIAPRAAKVVEMKFFGGLTFEEIAEALDLSVRTVKNDWAAARVHLLKALSSELPDGDD